MKQRRAQAGRLALKMVMRAARGPMKPKAGWAERLLKKYSKIFSAVEARAPTSMKKGNGSLAAGGLLALGSAACPMGPCPGCLWPSLVFIANGMMEKFRGMTRSRPWQKKERKNGKRKRAKSSLCLPRGPANRARASLHPRVSCAPCGRLSGPSPPLSS